jgi:hypothetical protein
MARKKSVISVVEKIEKKVEKDELKMKKSIKNLNVSLSQSGLQEYVTYLSSPLKVFGMNLFAGIARGLGFVLGATVVVAVLVFIIGKFLAGIPFVGAFFEWINAKISMGTVPGTQSIDWSLFFESIQNDFLKSGK